MLKSIGHSVYEAVSWRLEGFEVLMKRNNNIVRALMLITQLGLNMLVPIVLCLFIGTVSTSAGDFSFDKPAKTLASGMKYTVSGININAVSYTHLDVYKRQAEKKVLRRHGKGL